MADPARAFRIAERSNPLALGRWVTIKGLQKAVELNGLTGEIIKKEAAPDRAGVLVHVATGKKESKRKECSINYSNLIPFDDKKTVMGVRLGARGEGNSLRLLETRVPRQLLVDETPCPVPHLCGIPLMVAKVRPFVELGDRSTYDNQWATYLLISPKSGFAPPRWQSYVGPVVAYRDDEEDFCWGDMLILNSYLSHLLDKFSEGLVQQHHMTPRAYQRFKAKELEFQRMNPECEQAY
jgi:hypothetical protein